MKPEDQHEAIAKAHGWKEGGLDSSGYQIWISPSGARQYFYCIPDYLKDLNALREAIETLKPKQRKRFAELLEIIVLNKRKENFPPRYDDSYFDGGGWYNGGYDVIFKMIHATAPQLAEAFLRTLNLWKD